jgi:hypothetical protein
LALFTPKRTANDLEKSQLRKSYGQVLFVLFPSEYGSANDPVLGFIPLPPPILLRTIAFLQCETDGLNLAIMVPAPGATLIFAFAVLALARRRAANPQAV